VVGVESENQQGGFPIIDRSCFLGQDHRWLGKELHAASAKPQLASNGVAP
jgi:hypothetical protein